MLPYYIAAGLFLALLLIALLSLIFKKSRKAGGYGLLALVMVLVISVITTYFMQQPMQFAKHYLTEKTKVSSLPVKLNANHAGVYLGAAPNQLTQMLRPEFNQIFNSITPENALKISDLLNIESMTYNFEQADILVEQAISQNIRVRGHALVFGKLSDQYKKPDLDLWLSQFPEHNRKAKLATLVNQHIETVLNHYRGKIFEWDVVNEPFAMFGNGNLEENVFYRYLGPDYIAQAFIKAKAVDPNITLYLNEQFYNYTDARAEAFYQLVVSLLNKGIPIEGIGLQGHMLFYLASAADTAHFVKRFTDLGLKVQLTEFEARLRLFKDFADPYQAQGEYYRDVIQACYEINGFDGVTFWGVDDSYTWLNDMAWLFALPNEPYLLDAQHQAKPGLLLINQWLKSKVKTRQAK